MMAEKTDTYTALYNKKGELKTEVYWRNGIVIDTSQLRYQFMQGWEEQAVTNWAENHGWHHLDY